MKNLIYKLRHWNRDRKLKRSQRKIFDLNKSYKYRLAVLGIMKNEAMNICEWISHYQKEGVQAIYLIDNGSTDSTLNLLAPWVQSGFVKFIALPERHKQIDHYWTAIEKFKIKDDCQWLIVADLDEFWFCKARTSLFDSVSAFGDQDVIYVNWSIFGSNGYTNHPKSIRVSLTKRQAALGENRFTKYLVRTSVLKEKATLGIHKIYLADSSRVISDNQTYQINHYATQSQEYFKSVKMTRGDANNSYHDNTRTLDYFHKYDSLCDIEDIELSSRLGSYYDAV